MNLIVYVGRGVFFLFRYCNNSSFICFKIIFFFWGGEILSSHFVEPQEKKWGTSIVARVMTRFFPCSFFFFDLLFLLPVKSFLIRLVFYGPLCHGRDFFRHAFFTGNPEGVI